MAKVSANRIFNVDWTDRYQVIKLADDLGPGQTVFKVKGRDNYNITHTARTDQWLGHEVVHRT